MNDRHRLKSLTVLALATIFGGCSTGAGTSTGPARCQDLVATLSPERQTEIIAAARTQVAAADSTVPEHLGEAAATDQALAASRRLVTETYTDVVQVAEYAQDDESARREIALATAMPQDTRLARLERAYQRKSVAELDAFLKQWQAAVRPRDAGEVRQLSAAEQEVYALYQAFVRPGAVPPPAEGGLLGHGHAPAFPDKAEFVVVPTTMDILCVSDSLAQLPSHDPRQQRQWKIARAKVIDFRPSVDVGQAVPLYLSDEYESILTAFLGANSWGGSGGEIFPDHLESDRDARAEFWTKRVPLIPGHWSGWHLTTDPQVGFEFNDDMTAALVQFQLGYEGGTARAEKHDGQWVIVESRWEWIE